MKTLLISAVLAFALLSCEPRPNPVNTVNMADKAEPIKIEQLTHEVDHGLNRITLEDSTVILIYRGVESCTMIQLK